MHDMVTTTNKEKGSSDDGSPARDPKAFPEAAIVEESLFKRTGNKTFDNSDESLGAFYEPIESYEGRHRWDPEFQWEEKEERRVVRKIDYRICSWVCLAFFALQLDRGNISQALSDNMLDDIGITTNDYNTGQTIFFVTFLLAELPSQLISKKIGPDRWIPIQMVSWSLVASFQAFISGRSSFWACRALLGTIEGGFIPDNILYLSYFYTSTELPKRLSFFWTSYQFTSIVSAFLAFGLLRIWLFALEGTLTGIIGIITYFYLPPSPTQTASWFRGKKGWFSEREEKIMVNRILRDDPSKGDMHNRQGLSFKMFWDTLGDYHLWPVFLLGLSWWLPAIPMTQYITLQLKSAGFGTFETNLLTIPAYAIFIINLLTITYLSEKINERFLLATLSQWWVLPCLIALEVLPGTRSPWVSWILAVLVFAMPYVHAMLVAITSRNAGSVRTRTVATAIYNMSIQLSNIVGTNVHRNGDKPLYRVGNAALIGVVCWNILLFVAAKIFYVMTNRSRERKWSVMSKEEREHYLAATTDKDNKRLDFRFAH